MLIWLLKGGVIRVWWITECDDIYVACHSIHDAEKIERSPAHNHYGEKLTLCLEYLTQRVECGVYAPIAMQHNSFQKKLL